MIESIEPQLLMQKFLLNPHFASHGISIVTLPGESQLVPAFGRNCSAGQQQHDGSAGDGALFRRKGPPLDS